MLKKVTAVVMAAAMTIISLAGCGGDGGQGSGLLMAGCGAV